MGDNRVTGMIADWQRDPRGIAEAKTAIFRWRCLGCDKWEPLDVQEYLARVGPNYPMNNEMSVCTCGAPRALHSTAGPNTPLTPLRDAHLWIMREVNYGVDPEAWFEIFWLPDRPGRAR